MRRGAAYRQRFLIAHPVCCFCGGNAPATTIDHIPSRATFNDRQWPVGYDFPACLSCNSASAHDEQLISVLSRLGTVNPTEDETKEYQFLLEGLRNNHPDVVHEMRPSANQVRAFLRSRGHSLGNGLLSRDVPLLSVRGTLVKSAVAEFSRKLFLSLHYKHTCKVVSHDGGIAMKWMTNSTGDNPEFLDAINQLRNGLPHNPEMMRSSVRLENQFNYKYFTNDEGTFSAYFVMFRESFAMIGNVRSDSQDFPAIMLENGVLKPYQH